MSVAFHIAVHEEDGGRYWAEVQELPGCFATGSDLVELFVALSESVALYLGKDALDLDALPTEGEQ